MKHQAMGSITISTDAIAEAVYDRLAPLLQQREVPALLEPEQSRALLTQIIGGLEAFRTSPYSDHVLSTGLVNALLAAGYTLTPIPSAEQVTPEPEPGARPSFWGRSSD